MKYLIDADSTIPNVALMRLGSYFRARGEDVRLIAAPHRRELWDAPGEVFGSSIFKFAQRTRERIEREWGDVRWGGTGVRNESSLEEIDPGVDWESLPLDWSLYPNETRSIGFTQRGCRLRCKFCVVPTKEGKARSVHTIADIYRGPPHAKKIMLLDNDFFGQPRDQWAARINELTEGRFRVCFSQGINIRMVDDESAAAIATLEYRDNEFKERRLYTAWDNLGDERIFKAGVETLQRAGVPAKHLMVYMLVGFAPSETMDDVLYRFNEMVKLGCEPYPMVFDRSRKDLRAFARWAIRGLYRSFPFTDYDVSIKRPKKLPVVS